MPGIDARCHATPDIAPRAHPGYSVPLVEGTPVARGSGAIAMRVDVQIAFRLDREVEHAMARDLIEHVIEERDAGRKLGAAGAVEIHRDNDRRFPGDALDAGAARG